MCDLELAGICRAKSNPAVISERMCRATLTLLCLSLTLTPARGGSHEKRLVTGLLHNYQQLERPVAYENDSVPLTFGIS